MDRKTTAERVDEIDLRSLSLLLWHSNMQNENKQSIKEQNKKSAAGLNLQRSNYIKVNP